MKFIKILSLSFGVKILSLAILLISRILTAKILSPADFGSVGNALNLITIISRWGSLGSGPATQFAASKYSSKKNSLLIYAIIFSVFTGITALLIFYYFEAEISSSQFKNDQSSTAFLRFIPWLPVINLSMTLPLLLMGLGRFKEYFFTQVLPLLFQVVVISLAYNRQNAFELIIWAQVISWFSTVAITLVFIDYKNFGFEFDGKLFEIYSKYALKAWPQVILQFGISRFAVLIGSYFLSSQNLGYFILASNLAESFLILSTSLTPLIFNRIASGGPDFSFLGKSLRFSGLSFILVWPIVTCLGKPVFLLIFGLAYDPSWNLFLLLLISTMFHALNRICMNYIAAMGKNTILSGIQLAQLVLLFLGGFWACSVFGITGLCYASTTVSVAGFLSYIFIIKKMEEKQISDLFSLFLFNRKDINMFRRIFTNHKR